jgi:phosphate transport system substrate-binding protein
MDKLNLLQVDSGSGCVTPSTSTVQDATYTPLSRPLYMYFSETATQRPEVKAFIDYYVANEASLTTEALFVPLADQQLATAKTTAAGLAG